MWIEELSNGKFKYFERYKDPLSGRTKRVSVTMDRNTRQAQKQAVLHLQTKIDGILSKRDVSAVTFHQLFDEFVESWKPKVRKQSVITFRSIDKRLKQLIPSDVLANNIDRRYWQRIADKLYAAGFANQTLSKHYGRIRSVVAYGKRLGYITNDELSYVDFPKRQKSLQEVSMDLLSLADAQRIVAYFKANRKPYYADMVTVLIHTGLRFGELIALTEGDVDWSDQTLSITGTYSNREGVKGDTKTIYSNRSIEVSTQVLKAIQRSIARKVERDIKSDFIFVIRGTRPIHLNSFDRALKEAVNHLGITQEVSSHTFRKLHISLLAENNVPLKQIMARVGHGNPQTTLKIYTYVTEKMKSDLRDTLEKFAP